MILILHFKQHCNAMPSGRPTGTHQIAHRTTSRSDNDNIVMRRVEEAHDNDEPYGKSSGENALDGMSVLAIVGLQNAHTTEGG